MLLIATNISKSFGKKKILNDINLEINKGEIVGIVGKSGCGKSVLIKTLIGFLKPNSGSVTINSKLKFPIGYSTQENSLYEDLTVSQNLSYFADAYNIKKVLKKQKINLLLRIFHLQEYEKVLVRELSGGTKKRVDIACSLIVDPDLIILDEPFLGLDPLLVEEFLRIFKFLKSRGKTILISSHRTQELSEICSKTILIKNGKSYNINKNQLKGIY
jgi:ABC-type multidrug transport system ATPase subunit